MENTWWRGLDQLSDEQAEIIDLPGDKSYLVMGPPGSGKTNLLVLRANYLYLSGKTNLRIIVFTRALQEFLTLGADEYDFPADRITTLRRWSMDILREYGVSTEDIPDAFEEQRIYLLHKLTMLAKDKQIDGILDSIVLDEAQDYLPGEIKIFNQYAKNIFAVADSKQKIYGSNDCISTIKDVTDDTKILMFHYRNGNKICRFADAIAKSSENYTPLLAASNYDEAANPSSVDYVRCNGIDDEASRIVERLERQNKAYPGELLGVLCPTNDDVNAVWRVISSSSLSEISTLQSGDNQNMSFARDATIWVSTLHSFKGLEARAIHLAGLSSLKKFPNSRNLMYMAATRAKTALSLYSSDTMPTFLDAAINSLNPPKSPPQRADAFGGAK